MPVFYYFLRKQASRSRKVAEELSRTLETELGGQVLSGWEYRTSPDPRTGGSRSIKDRFVGRARGLLPAWMDTRAYELRPLEIEEGSARRPALQLRLVAGDALARVCADKRLGFIALERGDLVVASKRWASEVDLERRTTAALLEIARECKRRVDGGALARALAREANDDSVLLSERAEAIELLLEHFSDDAVAEEVRATAARSGRPILEVIAARIDEGAGRAVLEKYALDLSQPSSVRDRATNELLPTAEPARLIRLADAAPPGAKIALAHALARLPGEEEVSRALAGMLDGSLFVDEAVAEGLGAVGQPSALEPLVAALKKARAETPSALAIEAAIDRIRRRHQIGDQAGGLSLSGEGAAGGLSVKRGGGELSEVEGGE